MSKSNENPFRQWVQLEQPRLGSHVVYATDDFFAPKERLIQPAEPVFIPDKYDEHGKWMDGWESRRKRVPGHDYCTLRLGIPGVVRGLDIDTRHFTGNFPPAASVQACVADAEIPAADVEWQELLPKSALQGDSHNYYSVDNDLPWTHLQLHIYPDGGVARLRVYGEVRPDWSDVSGDEVIDLFALENGGRALVCNDEHFGSMHNLNVPGRGINMGDGWETARRRQPGNDWVIVALGHPGVIQRVEIDTAHFKGNYPDRAALQGALLSDDDELSIESASENWPLVLPETRLKMDQQHFFEDELQAVGPVSHLRLSIFPDGGVSRLRLFGHLSRQGK